MANSSTIGAAATTLASLATLGFTIWGFTETITHSQANMTYSNQVLAGYTIMAWMGIIFLAFAWSGVFYSVKRQQFRLGITGALLIFASCFVESATLIFAPRLNVGIALYPLESFGSIILIQVLLSLVGIVFTAKDRRQFA
jgi:hypothetical protein